MAAEKKAASVKVMILVNHLYLPLDPVADGWDAAEETVKVMGEDGNGRRVKLDVHPALAEFLQGRKQAEILD